MKPDLNVIEMPQSPARNNIPAALRALADQIEAGDYDDAHNLAWVIDCGNSRVEVGLLGAAPEPAATGFMLLHIGAGRLIAPFTS